MSERYSECLVCEGLGIKFPSSVQILQNIRLSSSAKADMMYMINTATNKVIGEFWPIECGSCDGTGFNGDAMDYYQRNVR